MPVRVEFLKYARGHRVTRHLTALCLALAAPLAAQEPGDVTVRVQGTILVNGFRNSTRVNNSDVPTFVLPLDLADPLPAEGLGATVRQARVKLLASVAEFHGAALSGELDFDLFGGQQPSSGGRTHPVVRIRRAYGEARWPRVTLLVGQEAPPVFELSPSSLASVGFPGFAAAGNLWLWLPQARVTWWAVAANPDGTRLALEGAVLAPSAGEPQEPFLTEPDRAERSGRPGLEGRVRFGWGGEDGGEVSAGGHLGWLAMEDGGREEQRAVGLLARVPLGRFVEVRGEAFAGEALGGLGGGGIGQSLGADGAIATTGGWGQLLVRPLPALELGLGYGVDDPDDGDAGFAGARLRNEVIAAQATWRAAPVVLGAEVRRMETTYAPVDGGRRHNTHLNLAAGFEF
jgi:hypothetical protein